MFFTNAHIALSKILPEEVVIDDEGNSLNNRMRQFRLYDDPERVGITVLERRVTRLSSQRRNIKWNKNDAGRIRGEIQNEVDRLALNGSAQTAEFTHVVRLGNVDQPRKLGLILDQESTLSELLVLEHEMVIDGINNNALRPFKEPYESFVPHWTVARVSKEANPRDLNKAVTAIQKILPITVQLEPIELFAHQAVRI